MDKNSLYLTFKTVVLAAVTAGNFSANTADSFTVAAALAFCCLFAADYLICRSAAGRFRLICAPIGIAGCFVCGVDGYFPVLLVLIFEIADLLGAKEYFYSISGAAALLSALIFQPDKFALITAALISAAVVFARIAIERLDYFRQLSETQRGTISSQSERIAKLQAYSATLRETAALEERSRFSTRIHDKLGHGISGSIILLEGAKLNLQKNPEQAKKSLSTAIENLRGSVDEIRAALREERPKRGVTNIAELREILERFSVDYEIKTEFSIEGDADKISAHILSCIRENLAEALTNTIKHSNANKFELKIRVYDKMIRAELSDNGTDSNGFSKGMGLEGIEDRVTVCGGKCLFLCGATGFKIINIFGVNYDQGIDSGR